MDGANPYAPPVAAPADLGPEPEPELPPWRLQGQTLLARHGTTLPDVCLFTGEPTTRGQRLRFPLAWTPNWFWIVVVMNPLMAVLGLTHFRRASNVDLALGPAGRRRHRLFLGLLVGASATGYAMLAAFCFDQTGLGVLLFVGMIGLAVAGLVNRTFRTVKIDRKYAHLALRPSVAAAFARLPPPPASG
jgi:hypothetical protein